MPIVPFGARILVASRKHEVDEHLQTVRVTPPHERFEFVDAVRRIERVIGADIEAILDGIRAPGPSLADVGVVRGLILSRFRPDWFFFSDESWFSNKTQCHRTRSNGQ